MSAVLLPFTTDGAIDWPGFEAHVGRTVAAGLVPAVNMDTGFGPVLDVADRAPRAAADRGEHDGASGSPARTSPDAPGAAFDPDGVRPRVRRDRRGAAGSRSSSRRTVWPRSTTTRWSPRTSGSRPGSIGCSASSSGPMFHPAGRIFTLDVFRRLLEIPGVIGLKHSSLDRAQEWERLAIRDAHRPGLPAADRQRPRDRHGRVRLRLPARPLDVRARRVRRARPRVGGRRRGRLLGAQRPAAVPRPARVPRPGARLPPRRGDVPRAARLDRQRPHPPRLAPPPRVRPRAPRRHRRPPRSLLAARGRD